VSWVAGEIPRAIFLDPDVDEPLGRYSGLLRSGPSSAIVITMRWRSALDAVAVITIEFVLLGAICTLVSCSGGSEEVGRIHVTTAEVTGVYKLELERTELRSNGTYVVSENWDRND
jgi:hypothetical protein